jgi:macrolide phosphotransferase
MPLKHPPPAADTAELRALAARHGLHLEGELSINELGLDYRIAIAAAVGGTRWVLRIPRRADAAAKVDSEARILAMLRKHVPFAVPDWRIVTEELVAYPMLEDSTAIIVEPGSTTPHWVIAQDSERFGESFAVALAKLHAVPVAAAEAAKMLVRTPAQARQKVADDIDRVRRELAVHDERLKRWQRWLDDDTSWPDFCAVVHGDLYVGHVLVDEAERVTGMIDWSECCVDDPTIDMTSHLMVFGEAGLAKLIGAYEAAGARVWPRIAHHVTERLAVSPVTYALFGLDSGHEDHLAAAKEQLAAEE